MNVVELRSIFHTNLTHFRLGMLASIIFTIKENEQHNTRRCDDTKQDDLDESNTQIGMLETIGVDSSMFTLSNYRMEQMLKEDRI